MSPKTDEPKKSFLDCFSDFISDPSGLAPEDIEEALIKEGADVSALVQRVRNVVREASKRRRLAWRDSAREKRGRRSNACWNPRELPQRLPGSGRE